jgi:aspartyl/asparaginyl beta-hydroxylase (cupin superfamily)
VGGHERSWELGRCIIFDDSFLYEVWNESDEDRVVLVVDLWHPDLSELEVALLEGLHRYAQAHADNLQSYWTANENDRMRNRLIG